MSSLLLEDNDIKIAGDKPSLDVKRNLNNPVSYEEIDEKLHKKAKEWGSLVAQKFIADDNANSLTDQADFEMVIQRRLLLSFAATIGFEKFSSDDTLIGVAQKSFIDTLHQEDEQIYKTSQDTGAFSFYYLAYRRGGEIERRIGQTFAMLCSHDGDPVYQELGEVLYCWFLSVTKKSAEKLNIN